MKNFAKVFGSILFIIMLFVSYNLAYGAYVGEFSKSNDTNQTLLIFSLMMVTMIWFILSAIINGDGQNTIVVLQTFGIISNIVAICYFADFSEVIHVFILIICALVLINSFVVNTEKYSVKWNIDDYFVLIPTIGWNKNEISIALPFCNINFQRKD